MCRRVQNLTVLFERSTALEPSYGIMANSESMLSWMKTLMVYSNKAMVSLITISSL